MSRSKSRTKSELENQLARALADYDNLRKRVEKERAEIGKLMNMRLIARFLSLLDMLEDAQKHFQDQGLAIIIKEFRDILKDENVQGIKAGRGIKFDEKIHETVEIVAGGKKGMIAKVLLAGWKFKDGPIIRPARVQVYK